MNINRYNYEEFFLLYVDNELTKAARAEVEAFVHDNPDLEEELVMLRQSKLRPDASIQFAGKESLLKPESASIVNETNYEEFFLLYIDNELSAVERREVEEFAATKPQFQEELNILLQTRAEPEHEVVFPDKSVLYKQPEKERPVVFMWRRVVAVAALLLLALGILWISNRTPKQEVTVAQKETPVKQSPVKQEPQIAKNNDEPVQRHYDEPVEPKKQLAKAEEIIIPQETQTIEKPLETASVASIENNSSANNTTGLNVNAVSSTQPLSTQPLVVQTVAYVPSQEVEDENVYIANTSVDKKNKLRGLFRKVTRVFEKTTNLPAVEEKGILIGSFEIALK